MLVIIAGKYRVSPYSAGVGSAGVGTIIIMGGKMESGQPGEFRICASVAWLKRTAVNNVISVFMIIGYMLIVFIL